MGYLYFVDKKGNICRTKMAQLGPKRTELVVRSNIRRVKGFLYFINKEGDIYCTPLNKAGAPKKKKKDLIKLQIKYVLYQVKGEKRAKKIRIAGITRKIKIPQPAVEKGVFGVRIKYEHKRAQWFEKASKFIRLRRGATKIRISDKLPKSYKN